jgi:dUTP pyrophosphatase
LHFYPSGSVKGFTKENKPIDRFPDKEQCIWVNPGERLLIPTGLVMKINSEHQLQTLSIRLHARSGMAYKYGLVLANAEGVIDADYQQQIFALMTNISDKTVYIKEGERICQGELVRNEPLYFKMVDKMPVQHSERDGGFGSTGTE